MGKLSGSISATLADRDETYEETLVNEINRAVKPPRPVRKEEVYIRAMYIVSDQVNSQGGKFAEDELDRLAELLIDSPVMVGHRRDSLPVARNFKAVKLVVKERTWIKSYFYWMKDSVGAEDLKKNIDGGIYKECSIGFLYTKPECSICGGDIRRCSHIPFHEYDVAGNREIAHFTYREIIRVLETSLVFRGAIPDTRITDRLTSAEDDPESIDAIPATHTFTISDTPGSGSGPRGYFDAPVMFHRMDRFVPDGLVTSVHMFPHQPGLPVRITRSGDTIDVETSIIFPERIRERIADMVRPARSESFVMDAILFACRGRDRLNGAGLMQAIESGKSLHRLRLKALDLIEIQGQSSLTESYERRCRRLRTLFSDVSAPEVTVAMPRHREPKTIDDHMLEEMSREFNFGVEAICERADGTLSRHVLTGERLVPVTIDSVAPRGRSGISVSVSNLRENNGSKTVIGSAMAGIAAGSVALVSETKKKDNAATWRLFDVIPGGESLRIHVPEEFETSKSDRLEIRRVGTSLNLAFSSGDEWLEATIHHFSTELFARRRKFIADVREWDLYGKDRPIFQVLPVRNVTRTGKMIRIALATLSKLFGNAGVLWLRPVLIDGRERYLFYADGISYRQGEV